MVKDSQAFNHEQLRVCGNDNNLLTSIRAGFLGILDVHGRIIHLEANLRRLQSQSIHYIFV